MQTTTYQKSQGCLQSNKWLRRMGVTGFVFFLAKGLVWILAAAWVLN